MRDCTIPLADGRMNCPRNNLQIRKFQFSKFTLTLAGFKLKLGGGRFPDAARSMSLLSISSNSSTLSVLIAQQRVQGDRTQVQQDQAQLRQDQAQLNRDATRLSAAQQQSSGLQQTLGSLAQQLGQGNLAQDAQAASRTAQPAPSQSPPPTVNTSGQTVGTVINVHA